MRIAWRTVGAIVARVWADADATVDRFAGLRRIGIDEISYKRHHNYITVVVDHDSGRLIWAVAGRDNPTLNRFFDALGDRARCAQITHVSADAAGWIADVVTQRCPGAIRCADPFHVVSWATRALDDERRRAWNDARVLARAEGKWHAPRRSSPRTGCGRAMSGSASSKHARYALWKNPEDLTEHQTRQAGLDRQDRSPTTPGLPAQRGPAARVFGQRRRRQAGPGPVDLLGPALPHPGVCRAGPPHRQTPPGRSTPPWTTACPKD